MLRQLSRRALGDFAKLFAHQMSDTVMSCSTVDSSSRSNFRSAAGCRTAFAASASESAALAIKASMRVARTFWGAHFCRPSLASNSVYDLMPGSSPRARTAASLSCEHHSLLSGLISGCAERSWANESAVTNKGNDPNHARRSNNRIHSRIGHRDSTTVSSILSEGILNPSLASVKNSVGSLKGLVRWDKLFPVASLKDTRRRRTRGLRWSCEYAGTRLVGQLT